VQIHRCSGGTGTGDALGIGVAGHHQDRHVRRQRPQAYPVALQTTPDSGEEIAASAAGGRSLSGGRNAKGGQ